MPPSLFDKIHGCNAAAVIVNSMGDITEGSSYDQIERRFGYVDQLLPQQKPRSFRSRDWGPPWVRHAHYRPPGMGEDGIERHRLMCTAIIEKGGRVAAWDVGRIWVRDINPKMFGYLMGNQDRFFHDALSAGFPVPEAGRYALWAGTIGTAKMMLPVGIVNAADPEQAARDAREIAQIKDTPHRPFNFAVEVCGALSAACCEAMRPQATVDSVITEALQRLSRQARARVEEALEWAGEADSVTDMRPIFAQRLRGKKGNDALVVFSTGLAIFRKVDGNTREAIVGAVNFGGDCDCIGYVAAGLSGALRGIESVPQQWVETIEHELKDDPYTVSRRSLLDTARGLHQALLNELEKTKERISQLKSAT